MTSEHENLRRRDTNFRPLTPLHFLLRSADVFPDRVAVIDGARSYTWRQHADRCLALASALRRRGVRKGETVAVLAPNTSAMLEAHFGIPMAGAVICALNVRLDARTLAFILEHGEAKMLLANRQFADLAREAVALCKTSLEVIGIDDPDAPEGKIGDWMDYEALLQSGDKADGVTWPDDEWDSIALNYTSGTTGNPKGAVYHHRGTYLNSIGQLLNFGIGGAPVYLWTLPMFHCNGWCFAWAVAAAAGTHVCLRKAAADTIFDAIARHDVTHMCCAPTVLNFVVQGAETGGLTLARPVELMTAGAAPPAPVLRATEALGFRVRHVYGMVEMHGVIAWCDWHSEWDALMPDERAKLRARQGVRTITCDDMKVLDPKTYEPVPADGHTMGEVMMRGSVTMKGYFKNPVATDAALAGGWYHSGDLAVVHPDGYIELRDRSSDIIISGGENISSIEIEDVLYAHPAVSCAAVIAVADQRWGEVPCAYVELKSSYEGRITADEIVEFCRGRMAKFKVPKEVRFGAIERTATGKVQKFKLRSAAGAA